MTLTDFQATVIVGALRVAVEVYRADATRVRAEADAQQSAGLASLAAQFDRQAADAERVLDQIEGAD